MDIEYLSVFLHPVYLGSTGDGPDWVSSLVWNNDQSRNCRNKPWYSEDSFLFAFSFSGITVLNKLMSNIFWVIVSYIFVWCFGCFTICLIFVTSSITKAKILLTFYSVLWHLLMTAVLTSNNWFHLFIGAWWFFLKSSFFFFN